jgi:SAM-dependent methyltransferase
MDVSPDPQLEHPPCALCGSHHAEDVYRRLADVRYGKPGTFTIVRCRECELCRLNPRPDPDSLRSFYDARRYVPFQADGRRQPRLRRFARNLLSVPYRARYGPLDALPAPPGSDCTMLDVGCGPGFRLEAMRRIGWHVWGVELDPTSGALAAERAGSPDRVIIESVTNARFDSGQFDLVTASHVLEHLQAPLEALGLIHDWLRPNGTLIVWVPNFGSFERRLFGRHWAGLDVPRHLYHYSLESLTTALEMSGFRMQGWRPQFQGSSLGDSVKQTLAALVGHSGGPPADGVVYEAFAALGWLLTSLGHAASVEVQAIRA